MTVGVVDRYVGRDDGVWIYCVAGVPCAGAVERVAIMKEERMGASMLVIRAWFRKRAHASQELLSGPLACPVTCCKVRVSALLSPLFSFPSVISPSSFIFSTYSLFHPLPLLLLCFFLVSLLHFVLTSVVPPSLCPFPHLHLLFSSNFLLLRLASFFCRPHAVGGYPRPRTAPIPPPVRCGFDPRSCPPRRGRLEQPAAGGVRCDRRASRVNPDAPSRHGV
jgi:hypothetical protein